MPEIKKPVRKFSLQYNVSIFGIKKLDDKDPIWCDDRVYNYILCQCDMSANCEVEDNK